MKYSHMPRNLRRSVDKKHVNEAIAEKVGISPSKVHDWIWSQMDQGRFPSYLSNRQILARL